MPGKEEDLRHAEAGADPDLNFSYAELLDELKTDFAYAEREPGDFSVKDMSDELGLSMTACRAILRKKMKAGEIERFKVKGLGDCHYEYVYRRAKK